MREWYGGVANSKYLVSALNTSRCAALQLPAAAHSMKRMAPNKKYLGGLRDDEGGRGSDASRPASKISILAVDFG